MDVKSLKDKILQLALQGKLVKQDVNDEPVSVLVKRIKEEKEKLIKEKKIKKEKPLPTITEEEAYMELPNGWEWCRLNDIYRFIDYRGKTPNKIEEGIPLVTAKNVKMGYIDYTIEEFISEEEFEDRTSRGISQKGDLLFTTEAPMGNVAIADLERFSAGQRLITFQQYTEESLLINRLFMYFIMSKQFQNQLLENKTGTTVYGIKAEKLKKILLPVPPLEEQKRIVAKIDELFVLIDELERDKIYLSNTITNTKNKLLQLAIQGKLVEQNEQDPPATVILETIEKTKVELIKNKKLKKTKPLPPIEESGIPYELPFGWKWVRLGEISKLIHYGYTASAVDKNTGVRMVRITDIQDEKVNWESVPFCEIEDDSVEKYQLGQNDILIARTGGTVGKSFLVDNAKYKSVFASYLIRIQLFDTVDALYVKRFLDSKLYWGQVQNQAKGTGQPNVNATELSNLILPLPPIEEQHRIVQKLNSIWEILYEIESNILSVK